MEPKQISRWEIVPPKWSNQQEEENHRWKNLWILSLVNRDSLNQLREHWASRQEPWALNRLQMITKLLNKWWCTRWMFWTHLKLLWIYRCSTQLNMTTQEILFLRQTSRWGSCPSDIQKNRIMTLRAIFSSMTFWVKTSQSWTKSNYMPLRTHLRAWDSVNNANPPIETLFRMYTSRIRGPHPTQEDLAQSKLPLVWDLIDKALSRILNSSLAIKRYSQRI